MSLLDFLKWLPLILVLYRYFQIVDLDVVEVTKAGWQGMAAPPLGDSSAALKTAVSIGPMYAHSHGIPLGTNPALCAFALIVLSDPLTLATAGPNAGDSRHFGVYLAKWLSGRLDSYLKTGAIAVVFWLLSFFPGIRSIPYQHWLDVGFGLVPRTGNLYLPGYFYLTLLFMMFLRVAVSFGVRMRHYWINWPCLCAGVVYFYNLTRVVPLEEKDWEAPAMGVVGGFIFSFLVSYAIAKLDES